jgi:hypothetical protein
MAAWDSADLLARFNRYAGRPSSDEISDATKYARLAEAQSDVIHEIAAIYPYCLYRSAGPATLTTSDNKVYTFGNDGNSVAMGPVGHVKIFRNLADYPDCALVEGVDYLNEGTQIRIPNNRTEGTLYWHGIPIPIDIASGGSAEPALRPAPSRVLIVIRAVWNFALEGNRDAALAEAMERKWYREFPKWMLVFKTQFSQGGALGLTGVDRAVLRQDTL